MKVGLLGTGFGIAHARIYHTHPQVSQVVVFGRTPAKLQAFADEFGYATTTDVAAIYDDPTVDLVDVCLPTGLHTEHVTRALQAGKHVLCELPLAATMDDARRIVDAQAASDRQAFVDMFGRFDPATEFLHTAIAEGRLRPAEDPDDGAAQRPAVGGLPDRPGLAGHGRPAQQPGHDRHRAGPTGVDDRHGRGQGHRRVRRRGPARLPERIVRCGASALLPKPYGMRGGYRAVFTQGAIESSWTAGYDGRPTTTLTEYTEQASREVDLPARDAYAAVIDHVLACCQGRDGSRLSPASVLDTLQLTLDIHAALAAPRRP